MTKGSIWGVLRNRPCIISTSKSPDDIKRPRVTLGAKLLHGNARVKPMKSHTHKNKQFFAGILLYDTSSTRVMNPPPSRLSDHNLHVTTLIVRH